jgi:hypothetical protein
MQLLEKKFQRGIAHHNQPGRVAGELFQTHDFGKMSILDSDGADSEFSPSARRAVAHIKFYVESEHGGDSCPMQFSVEFVEDGAWISVYSL